MAVGLPVVLPVDDKTKPGGRAPELIDHLYGFTPPAAPKVTVRKVSPTCPMWKGTLVMISFVGLGDAFGDVEAGGGVSEGVGATLGVGLAAAVDGVASGEVVGCWLTIWAQPDSIKTNPATKVAGNTPLLT